MTDGDPPAPSPPEPERLEVVREAVTMALYLSLSLLAVVLALPSDVEGGDRSAAWTVLLASVGLLLAHQVAFRMSTRLVNRGRLGESTTALLAAQLVGGAAVTALAVLPLAVAGASALPLSVALLVAFVAIVGYATARSVPVSRPRALVYVGLVVAVVLIVLAVKGLVSH